LVLSENGQSSNELGFRAGFFGKEAIDEDAVEMLGSLPVDRALSILTNIEETRGASVFATIW
jgi:hypothetical protein